MLTTAEIKRVRPLKDNVLVRLRAPEEDYSGPIAIPQAKKVDREGPALWGEVVSVGPGYTDHEGHRHDPVVKVGHDVLVGKYQGTSFKVDGNEYLILTAGEIRAYRES